MVKYIKIYILVKNMKEVKIYTDGACSGNPGKGGWAAILVYGNKEKELVGGGAFVRLRLGEKVQSGTGFLS